MTWTDFHDHFNALFGAGDWADDSVAVWICDIFMPGGVTPQEADLAALAVARAGPPAKPYEVLRAVLDAARRRRADELLAREEQEREGGGVVGPGEPCRDCDGTGWAVVPHHPQPDHAAAKGFLATHAVTCSCAAGRRLAGLCRDRQKCAPMTLADYEDDNPGWREQLRRATKQAAADGRIAGSTKGWDEAVARVLKGAERRKQK